MKKLMVALMLLASISSAQKLDLSKPIGVVARARHLSVKVIALKHYDIWVFNGGMIEKKRIYGYGMGTGFFIGNSTILTEDHITNGAEKLLVLRHGRTEFEEVTMVSSSSAKDFSILRTKQGVNSQALFNENFQVGQKVIVVGNAGADDFEIAEGRIAGVSLLTLEEEGLRTAIHIDSKGKIRPGFSGGAVFNMDGGVVGMVEAVNNEGYGMAIKASEIVDYLAEQGPDVHRSIVKYEKRRK